MINEHILWKAKKGSGRWLNDHGSAEKIPICDNIPVFITGCWRLKALHVAAVNVDKAFP